MTESEDAIKLAERHNASVDEDLANSGACAQVHLATGRTCVLPARHRGSCQFVAREELRIGDDDRMMYQR